MDSLQHLDGIDHLDDAPADEWGPEHDAWRYELGPEPADADRAWWAGQNVEGGMVEGESDRSDINAFTVSAFEHRLDQMATDDADLDRYEGGITSI